MRVIDQFLKCVIFLGVKENERFVPKATGFVVSWESNQFNFQYLVTAEHIISGIKQQQKEIWIRVNLNDGGVLEEKIEDKYLFYHPMAEQGGYDVAILSYHVEPREDILVANLTGEKPMSATAEIMIKNDIGVGDEIFIVGLFRTHFGQQRNIPLVRIGNIASMRTEPVRTKYCGFMDAYLIEAHSIGGLSGSPVFVQMPPIRPIPVEINPNVEPINQRFFLLGLMHGHFDIADLNLDTAADDLKDASQGINSGVGVVVPVEHIIQTIEQPDVQAQRDELIRRYDQVSGAANPDAPQSARSES